MDQIKVENSFGTYYLFMKWNLEMDSVEECKILCELKDLDGDATILLYKDHVEYCERRIGEDNKIPRNGVFALWLLQFSRIHYSLIRCKLVMGSMTM